MTVPDTAEERSRAAGQEIRSAAFRLAKTEVDDPDVLFETREIYPGAGELWVGRHLRPVPALRWTRELLLAAIAEEREAISLARGREGLTWRKISDLLGLTEQARRIGMDPAYGAWRYAAMRVTPRQEDTEDAHRLMYPRGPEAPWRCWTCGNNVYEGHPANGVRDAQRGHGEGCALLRKFAQSERISTERKY